MGKAIKEYDDRGNLVYNKDTYDNEFWWKYDENDNEIYYKSSDGNGYWKEYNKNNKIIHFKTFFGDEIWWKYDESDIASYITEKEYKEIEFRKKEKEYLSRKKCSRFEIMDI